MAVPYPTELNHSCFFHYLAHIARTITSAMLLDKEEDVEAKLMLCGSRGVGVITVASEGTTLIELLDIEEDEEEDDEEEEDEDFDDDVDE